MSENRKNRQCVSIPADWSLPKFHLACASPNQNRPPDATRIQTGRISGIEYITADSLCVTQRGVKPGWYYAIAVDADDARNAIDPVLCIEESDICELIAVS